MFGGFSRLYFRYVIKSKNAEARAEQQARLIAMPSRESSSDLHHAQPSLDFDDKITNDMDTKQQHHRQSER